MKPIEHVLIAGLGAVGGTLAAQIYDHNPASLSIMATGERFERYHTKGIYINEKKYNFTIVQPNTPLYYDNEAQENKYTADLIVIACKNQHLARIRDDIASFVSKDTIILSLLNGITSEDFLAERYGHEKIPYALILGTDAQHTTKADGASHTVFAQKGIIHFGNAENNQTKLSNQVTQIAEFFKHNNIAYDIPDNMIRRLWSKFMINVGINQCSAILRLPYGPFQHNSYAQSIMESAMREVIELSKKTHINLTDDDITQWYKTLHTLTPESRTSMCQDVCAGRKTEVELFAQTVIDLGIQYNIPTPVNTFLYNALRTIESEQPSTPAPHTDCAH